MWIISYHTEETRFFSGIKTTGRAFATVTTASRHATRIILRSTSTECRSPTYTLRFRLDSGVYLWGWIDSPPGGFTSLHESKRKTVAPSRVKNRKFEGPPVYWDPDSPPFTVIVILSGKRKMRIFRTFPIAAAENSGGVLHTEFRYKTD